MLHVGRRNYASKVLEKFRHTVLGIQCMLSRIRACFGNLEMALKEIAIVDVGTKLQLNVLLFRF